MGTQPCRAEPARRPGDRLRRWVPGGTRRRHVRVDLPVLPAHHARVSEVARPTRLNQTVRAEANHFARHRRHVVRIEPRGAQRPEPGLRDDFQPWEYPRGQVAPRGHGQIGRQRAPQRPDLGRDELVVPQHRLHPAGGQVPVQAGDRVHEQAAVADRCLLGRGGERVDVPDLVVPDMKAAGSEDVDQLVDDRQQALVELGTRGVHHERTRGGGVGAKLRVRAVREEPLRMAQRLEQRDRLQQVRTCGGDQAFRCRARRAQRQVQLRRDVPRDVVAHHEHGVELELRQDGEQPVVHAVRRRVEVHHRDAQRQRGPIAHRHGRDLRTATQELAKAVKAVERAALVRAEDRDAVRSNLQQVALGPIDGRRPGPRRAGASENAHADRRWAGLRPDPRPGVRLDRHARPHAVLPCGVLLQHAHRQAKRGRVGVQDHRGARSQDEHAFAGRGLLRRGHDP